MSTQVARTRKGANRTKRARRFTTHPSNLSEFCDDLNIVLDDLSSKATSDHFEFAITWLKSNLTRKLRDPNLVTPSARKEAAIAKWLSQEELNLKTNDRVWFSDPDFGGYTATDVMTRARQLIRSLLGEAPDYADAAKRMGFTGGASTDEKRQVGSVAKKYQMGCDITEDAVPLAMEIIPLFETWHTYRDFDLVIVPGNVMFTVPKSSDIDRVACKEPSFNMFMQRGMGLIIRDRLKHVGINLRDQRVNQRLAKRGSIDGSLATIDLSSASDSVTTNIVAELLPPAWFADLNSLRCKYTQLPDGSMHENSMFSSMGNGFTFELESLIFWALSKAILLLERRVLNEPRKHALVAVYGDDIIVPTWCARKLMRVFHFFGFRPNLDKSFVTGPFRESCGKHYYSGYDVTPFYIQEIPSTVVDWITLLNKLRLWAEQIQFGSSSYLRAEIYPVWEKFALRLIPRPLWGGSDYRRSDVLVASGIRPKARLVPRKRDKPGLATELQMGMYMHWLSSRDDSQDVVYATAALNSLVPLQGGGVRHLALALSKLDLDSRPTSLVEVLKDLELRRHLELVSDTTPQFPHEIWAYNCVG